MSAAEPLGVGDRPEAHAILRDRMASSQLEIPERALYRAGEVCEIAAIQPYVLRTWEAEFPTLGVAKTPGGPRAYRRQDLERVLTIKQLLFGEGLTLAGVRRRLDENGEGAGSGSTLDGLLAEDVRARLAEVKRAMRSVLELLSRERSTPVESVPTQKDDLPLGEPPAERQPVAGGSNRPRRAVKTRHASA